MSVSLEETNDRFLNQIAYIKENHVTLQTSEWADLFFSHSLQGDLYINLYCLKYMASWDPVLFISLLRLRIQSLLHGGHSQMNVHVCLKSLTVTQMSKYFSLFKETAATFKKEFPHILDRCVLYHGSSIVSQIFSLVSKCLEKETMQRITLYKPAPASASDSKERLSSLGV